jgi:hypothetical protein
MYKMLPLFAALAFGSVSHASDTPTTPEAWAAKMTDPTRNAAAFKDPAVFAKFTQAMMNPATSLALMQQGMDPNAYARLMSGMMNPASMQNYIDGPIPPADPCFPLMKLPGVELGIASAGIKKPGRRECAGHDPAPRFRSGGRVHPEPFLRRAGHRVQGTPACREGIRALVVNTGNANAGTGEDGLRRARETCAAAGRKTGHQARAGAALLHRRDPGTPAGGQDDRRPARRRRRPEAGQLGRRRRGHHDHRHRGQGDFAQGGPERRGVRVTGIAKGSGMIHPNMATMLSFVATDAPVSCEALEAMLRHAVNKSFNCITVDGDTSTNDSCILIATGARPRR